FEQTGLRRIPKLYVLVTIGANRSPGLTRKETEMGPRIMTHDGQNGIILIVDDNLDVRVFAKGFLEHAGYSVVTAADGEEGLRSYQTHQSSIVLLLTDVMMPNMN